MIAPGGIAAIVLALAASSAALAADNPLARAVPMVDGASACFARSYDAAHLRQHPPQKTQAVLVSLRFEEDAGNHIIRVMLREKNRTAPLYIVGVCGWSDKANLGVDGK